MGNMFYRIEQDLKDGRKKKACDRLRNMINQFPDDISLREKLAQIYYDSGFKDEAGKFWILSEPQNFEMKEAVEIYRNSLSNSGNAILKDIVFRGDKNRLSEHSKNILNELESDSFKRTKHVPDFKPKKREKGNYAESKDNFFSRVGFLLLIGGIILLPFLGIVKLYELLDSLFFK
ncbi:hypothetical protein SAMN05443633_105219 [Chryseobacterium arachidis]|uniref:Uncharacterized protein n=1 Tax=Chryseobacterium arachidis TaxID=1416778 RepID=A0A1M5D9V6_9FLAO|nr:DUF6584 family protein [Chryseobacterium arachidis]SHF63843.1 hypothetical protein SAMN05443633_105219 [Chryseobacterium arachidis]